MMTVKVLLLALVSLVGADKKIVAPTLEMFGDGGIRMSVPRTCTHLLNVKTDVAECCMNFAELIE